jgi:adenine-specific DNA glycosylase
VSPFSPTRRSGQQNEYPVKLGGGKTQEERRTLFWIEHDGKVLAWQRPSGARLMPGFWELPECAQIPSAVPGIRIGEFRHAITFHRYRFEVCDATVPDQTGDCQWLELGAIALLPVSTILRKAYALVKRNPNGAAAVAGKN